MNGRTCGFNWQCTVDVIGYAVMVTAHLDSSPFLGLGRRGRGYPVGLGDGRLMMVLSAAQFSIVVVNSVLIGKCDASPARSDAIICLDIIPFSANIRHIQINIASHHSICHEAYIPPAILSVWHLPTVSK